jgi:DNA polymerase-4
MPEIVHIDLEGFFVAVERLQNPSLCGRPLIIGGQPTGWGRVVAASAEARERGVRPGLSLAIAAMRCPDAVFLDGAVERYLEASAAVDEIVRDPAILGTDVPVEWAAIDSVFLDVSGTSLRIGPARAVAERVQARVHQELGFEAACGIAGSRIAAQMASRLSRPHGLLYVLPGYEARLLAPLDLDLLPDLPGSARQRLMQAGITTLGALGSLDTARATDLIGRRGPTYASWARGVDPRPVDGSQPPRTLTREVTLSSPCEDETKLLAILQHVTETLAGRLRTMGWFARTVTVRVRPTPGSGSASIDSMRAGGRRGESRAITLREATASEHELRTAARALFQVVRRRRQVDSLAVTLSGLQRVGPQMPLFPLAPPREHADEHVRTRLGLRSLVEGGYLRHQRPQRRVG